MTYERGFATLGKGDLCVLFTDGIIEAAGAEGEDSEQEYGLDRLIEVIRAHQQEPAEEIVQAVFESVEEHCGTDRLNDDRTVVIVKRVASVDLG